MSSPVASHFVMGSLNFITGRPSLSSSIDTSPRVMYFAGSNFSHMFGTVNSPSLATQ